MAYQSQSKFHDFEQALHTEVAAAINTLIEAVKAKVLTVQQLSGLSEVLKESYPAYFSTTSLSPVEDPGYGADFDLTEEVNNQIKVIRALRNRVIDPETGNITEKCTSRDAKELVSSSSTLLSSLMKFHDRIINQDRDRAIESATIEAVRTLPKEAQTIFFNTLEQALGRIK